MSDVTDGSGPVPRRTPRSADGGAPVSGALAIVLAVIAVVAGFLILRSISDGGDKQLDVQSAGTGPAEAGNDGTGNSTVPSSLAPTTPVATTEPPLVTDGATVVVANANGIGGSAATTSRALEAGPGFTIGEPTDASSATGNLDTTVIYYDPAQPQAQAVADSVGRALGGGVTVLVLQGTPPTASGDLGGAGVLVMLGLDKANKTLEELNGATTDTSPALITNPPLSTTIP